MRINGFTQMKAFYSIVFNGKHDFKPHHVSLYLFFLNQNNRNNWVEWFKCPYDLAMHGACIGSKRMYYKCLEDLKVANLIDYQKGANMWKAPKVKLEVLKGTSTVTSTVPLGEQVDTPVDTQLVLQLAEQLSTHKYKPITINLLTSNLKRITERVVDVIDFLNKEEKQKKDSLGCEELLEITNLFTEISGRILTKPEKHFPRVKSLLKDYSFENFKEVFELKTYEWANDDKMKKYLTLDTILQKTKFPKYIDEVANAKLNPSIYKKNKNNNGTIDDKIQILKARRKKNNGVEEVGSV